MDPVRVAAVQAAPVLLDRDQTIAKVVELAGKAAADGARLVAFPEAFVPGYPDWVWRTRPWDADATALYARLFDQAVVIGSPAIGPEGEVLAGPLVGEEGVLYAEIDATRARASRQQFDPVGHYSRPDIFRLSVDTSLRPAVTETPR